MTKIRNFILSFFGSKKILITREEIYFLPKNQTFISKKLNYQNMENNSDNLISPAYYDMLETFALMTEFCLSHQIRYHQHHLPVGYFGSSKIGLEFEIYLKDEKRGETKFKVFCIADIKKAMAFYDDNN